jgi:hypothetical protein
MSTAVTTTTDIQDLIERGLRPDLDNAKLGSFVRAYDGDLVYALRIAGYQGTDLKLQAQGQELLRRPDIQQAIRNARTKGDKREANLLTKIDRMEFLTSIVRNADPFERMVKDDYGQEVSPEPPTMAERLKALDMFNKMEGDYHSNINVNHNHSITDLVLSSFMDVTRPIEAIEADYKDMTGKTIPDLDTLGL